MAEPSGGTKTFIVDPCHFDVMVSAEQEKENEKKFLNGTTEWNLTGTPPEYISFTTPNGSKGGIWVFPLFAPANVNFFHVDDVQEFIDEHGADILNVQWQGEHPRNGKDAAILKDPQCVLWGIHE